MSTKYPIEFKRGKLVKHLKPSKPHLNSYYHSRNISKYDPISVKELMDWVDENGGEYEDAFLEIEEEWGYGSDCCATGTLRLEVPLSQDEIDQLEKNYQKDLKEWEEWKILSKEARETEEIKEKEKRAKSLKTQENNLLKELKKVREQQDKL